MNDTSRKTLQYITELIVPMPREITESQCSTETIPIAFTLSSQQTLDLWQKFVDYSGSRITFFDFSTIKIIQLCEFMHERFDDETLFERNILSKVSPYVFAGENTLQPVNKSSFDVDIATLRQKYPESAIAGVYNPLRSYAEGKYTGSDIPAIVQITITNLNRVLFNNSDSKFNFVLENFTPILHCRKELDTCIANEKSGQENTEDEEDDYGDYDDDYDENVDEISPIFVEGFLCDLKPVEYSTAVLDGLRRLGHKIYFGLDADSVLESEAKNYRKLSMKIIKLKNTISGGGFYWVRCPEDAELVDEILDVIS